MSFLTFFLGQKKKSNQVAKERLKLILVHDRQVDSAPDFLPQLQRELIEVISKYISVNPEDIKVSLDKQDSLDVLEVKIEMSANELNNANLQNKS